MPLRHGNGYAVRNSGRLGLFFEGRFSLMKAGLTSPGRWALLCHLSAATIATGHLLLSAFRVHLRSLAPFFSLLGAASGSGRHAVKAMTLAVSSAREPWHALDQGEKSREIW